MAEAPGRTATVAAAAAALVAGLAAGWLGGRASFPEAPPPPTYFNPLSDAAKDETLAHVRPGDRTVVNYRVSAVDAATVLLTVETSAPGLPADTQQVRVSRSFFGPFLILEGDVKPEHMAAVVRDFVLESVSPETIRVESLGRDFRCWKFVGRHRLYDTMTYWISDEVPVHGVVRVSTPKGIQWELHGFGVPK